MNKPAAIVIHVLAVAAMVANWRAVRADAAQTEKEFDFFVSPQGNDGWSGRLAEPHSSHQDGPFATLEKAKSAVRDAIAKNSTSRIRVALRDGVYRLKRTVVFSMKDSAGPKGNVTYAAYPGETPVLSSGILMKGWRKLESLRTGAVPAASGRLWTAEAPPEVANILSLYDGLKRLPRAQGDGFEPPHGWKDDAAGRGPSDLFYFPKGVIDRYANFRGADLLVMPTANYEMNILPIAYVDRTRMLGVTQYPASRPMGPMQFHTETMWIENRIGRSRLTW